MKIILSSKLEYDNIVNGEGLRTVIWTQGCPHHCVGCHNPETHDITKGKAVDVEIIKKQLAQIKNQDGITLSGGEPFVQPEACAEIARYAKELNLNVWSYTGYKYEDLLAMAKENPIYMEMLKNIDVLVDGKFILGLRSLNLKFRGSSNQRVIDVQKSLKADEVVLIDKYSVNKEEPINLCVRQDFIYV